MESAVIVRYRKSLAVLGIQIHFILIRIQKFSPILIRVVSHYYLLTGRHFEKIKMLNKHLFNEKDC